MATYPLTPAVAAVITEFVDIVEQSVTNYEKMTTSIERKLNSQRDTPQSQDKYYDIPETLIVKMNEIRSKMIELKPEGIALIDEWIKEYTWRFEDTERFCLNCVLKKANYETRKECREELVSALYEYTMEAEYLISQMRFNPNDHGDFI